MRYIEIKAPAKINIGLNIISKREDGYHNLETLFYPLHDFFDLITIEKSDKLILETNNSVLSVDENNLIIKAIRLIERKAKLKINLKIFLHKNIPIGAGLGGGSSDAAAILISLNDIFRLGFSFDQLRNLGLELGSDVPFFIKAKPALGRSRGEELTIIDLEIKKTILLINPGIHISTKEAFANITPKPVSHDLTSLPELIRSSKELSGIITNDFEEYVFSKYPEIAKIKKTMYDSGASFSSLSGSGATVYGFFDNLDSAQKTKQLFPENYFSFISCDED